VLVLPAIHDCVTQDLRAKADLMERRLLAAERLIAGLGSEKERWAADIMALETAREQLVGDCLLCSSFLSYTGGGAGSTVCLSLMCCWLPVRAACKINSTASTCKCIDA
jgi:hypothetical protein